LGVGDDELVIARNELDDVNDRLFEISVAVAQANDQLADGLSAETVLQHLLGAVDHAIGTN